MSRITKTIAKILIVILPACLPLSGCGGRAYVVEPFDPGSFLERAHSETQDGVTVQTTVVSADETELIFGLPLYDSGVQPVWIRVQNNTDKRLRYAPVSTDRYYFAPLEVSYVNRSGFSDDARDQMNWRFHELAMPRRIQAGESVEGFVFTHMQAGTKGFNIDLFGDDVEYRFNFFVTLPGFVADHSEIDLQDLYAEDELAHISEKQFLTSFANLPCCTSDANGNETGSPLGIAIIGQGKDVLHGLLRGRWREVAANETFAGTATGDYYYFGRPQDATFIYEGRKAIDGYYELRLWLAPQTVDDKPVWLGQLRQFFAHRWTQHRPDPDTDNAQSFLLQNIWYSGTLLKYSILQTSHKVGIDDQHTDFQNGAYFTVGRRSALWISGDAVPLNKVQEIKFSGDTHD